MVEIVDNLSKFKRNREEFKASGQHRTPPALPKIRPEDLVEVRCKAQVFKAADVRAECGCTEFAKVEQIRRIPAIIAAGRPDIVTRLVYVCNACGTVLDEIQIVQGSRR